MSTTSTSTGATPAPMSLPARFIGIITSPGDTFRAVVAHPRWLGMLIVVMVIVALGQALPLTTEAGKEAALRTQVEWMEGFGMQVSNQAYEAMRARMSMAPITTPIGVLIFGPIMEVIFAGILFVIFNVAMGGGASFKQMFALLVHSSVISALQALFTGPLNYFRGSVSSATSLAVLLPMVEAKSFVGRVLAGTDLFLIWRLVVLAIGLAVLYKRRTQPIAMTLLAIYAVLVLGFAAIMSSFS
jgi:hypothetical protein